MIDEDDREVCIGENRMVLDSNNILYLTLIGEIDGKTVMEVREADLKFKEITGAKLNALIKTEEPELELHNQSKNGGLSELG